ncbi:MAG: M28 family peptidase [Acidimicrobiia bacterium]|nr:M28 family peptidase [Acidimicrobiia bacterium]
MERRTIVAWLIALALVGVGMLTTVPVAAVDDAAVITEFSAARAMEHIEQIAQRPHPMGSAEIAVVRTYLVDELEAMGLEVDLQTTRVPDYFAGTGTVDLANVIGWIPGLRNTKAVVLMAHYDTHPATPGANDNSAAVAVLLEAARALQAGQPLANDVVFLFTDGEEPSPQYGSNAFAAVPQLLDTVGLVVNFEALGSTGASMLVEVSGPEAWLVDQLAVTSAPAAFSFNTQLARLLGEIGTDFDAFREAGVPGFHFAYARGSPIYHTAADDVASVDPGSVQHHGMHAVAIARHFGDLDLTDVPEESRAVYFTFGSALIRYSTAWAGVLVVVAVVGLAWAASRRSISGVLRAMGATALGVLAGAGVGTVVWVMVTSVRSTPGITESYLYGAIALGSGGAIALRTWRRLERGGGSQVAAAAVWVLLAAATAVWLPGFSYLFVWPALVAVVLLAWRTAAPLTRFTLLAIPTIVLLTPAIDTFFLFAQPRPGNTDSQITAAVFIPLMLALLVVSLLSAGSRHPTGRAPVAGD